MLAHAPVVGRPYRSKRQKPCSACRRRRVCCVREGNSACALCSRRGLDCVVEPSTEKNKDASEKSRPSKAPARNLSPCRDYFGVNTTIPPSSTRRVSEQHVFQYVGPSGDYDPYILLHRSQEGAVREGVIHWSWQRVSKNSHYPIHFLVTFHQCPRPIFHTNYSKGISGRTPGRNSNLLSTKQDRSCDWAIS